MAIQITIPGNELKAFCKTWKIAEFAFFGSVLREDFHAKSDIDVLVSFTSDAAWDLIDYVSMVDELQMIFGRKVDLLERETVEKSKNDIRRNAILSDYEIIHAA